MGVNYLVIQPRTAKLSVCGCQAAPQITRRHAAPCGPWLWTTGRNPLGAAFKSLKKLNWLGDLDSNQGCPGQSREFYR